MYGCVSVIYRDCMMMIISLLIGVLHREVAFYTEKEHVLLVSVMQTSKDIGNVFGGDLSRLIGWEILRSSIHDANLRWVISVGDLMACLVSIRLENPIGVVFYDVVQRKLMPVSI